MRTIRFLLQKEFRQIFRNKTLLRSILMIEEDKADIILEIPSHFERNLVREGKQKLFIAANAINGPKALVGSGYLGGIIAAYNAEVRMQWIEPGRVNPLPNVEIVSSNWYNPMMNYKIFMVPGILVLLVTMVGSMLCALNIVRNRNH